MADLVLTDQSQLLIQLISLLDNGFASYTANPYNASRPLPDGLTSARAFQPRQQGANVTATVYVNALDPRPVGFTKRVDKWDAVNNVMLHTESQRFESTYHIEALVPQSPAAPTAMTEIDVLNVARFILQSSATIETLRPLNVGVMRVGQLRSSYIDDDKEQNENVPFFEIVFTHRTGVTQATPIIDQFDTVFARV